jgi:hypothetical protein
MKSLPFSIRFFSLFPMSLLLFFTSCGPSVEDEQDTIREPMPPFHPDEQIFQYIKGKKLPTRQDRGSTPRFTLVGTERTGVSFVNKFQPNHPRKALYSSGFSCGGIAIGDINGDGWPDVFFTGGPTTNKLYSNLGKFHFRDVTSESGLSEGGNPWSAGAAFADIDADGDLDLYVCNYDTPNQLWLNNGSGKFIEKAKAFGVDTVTASLMPYFQDFDRDGDLDFFLLTNRLFLADGRPKEPPFRKGADGQPEVLPSFQKYFRMREAAEGIMKLEAAGLKDHLYRNDGGIFKEVSVAAGIVERGHGLSAAWWDYDDDGDQDLYVANDFNDPDHLYRNDGGTFVDVISETFPHVAWFAMGSDLADLDGNGADDLFTLDMSGTNHFRQKTTMGTMSTHKIFLETAIPRQYMRNALLMNEGNGIFREAAYLAGLADADWGWAPKLEDFDEDGMIDAFITNGMTQNFTDADHPMSNQDRIGKSEFDHYRKTGFKKDVNLAFRNAGRLDFQKVSEAWGLDHEGMSFAAAHGDLDRDGDLDLVVANLNEPVHVYRNDSFEGNRLLLCLKEPNASGSKVTVVTAKRKQSKTLRPATGFMSSDEPILHFGLGEEDYVGVMEILWADGTEQSFGDLHANYYYEITKDTSEPTISEPKEPKKPLFRKVSTTNGLRHEEKPFDDYKIQPLLPHKLSRLGPGMAWTDIDANGFPDLFLGGAAETPGSIWLNYGNGEFRRLVTPAFDLDKNAEDIGALFFDYDSDGRTDLLVTSGGIEATKGSKHYTDRLYRNAGGFRFERVPFPGGSSSSGPAAACDFDRDGDLDLFIGGRLTRGEYPLPGTSRLLRNDKGNFADATKALAPGLATAGMVTGAMWTDATGDGWTDLLVTTEWGPVKLFQNHKGKLVDATKEAGLSNLTGWWTGIAAADFDRDGDIDYAVGNLGLNTKYKVSEEHPFEGYYGMFDNTGRKRFVEATWENDKLYPVRGLSCSSDAMPFVNRKFLSYADFAKASIPEIYSSKSLGEAHRVEAKILKSGILLNDGSGHFSFNPLPHIAQIAPTFGIVAKDFDADGKVDLALAQNFFSPQPETGRMDGGLGQFLQGLGDGTFLPIAPKESGITVRGDARSLAALDLDNDGRLDLAFARNNSATEIYLNNPSAPMGKNVNRDLRIRLKGPKGNPTGIGSKVTLHLQDGNTQTAEIHAGSGYLTQTPPHINFGLGKDEIATILVQWTNGKISTNQISTGTSDVIISSP